MDADRPRLCLILPLDTPLPAADTVANVLAALKAATLVLSPGETATGEVAALEPFVKAAQAQGVAVLVENDWRRAKDLQADGVHLAWRKDAILDTFEDARKALGVDHIVGADVGRSRHDAMEVGEAGADYVAFGIPPHVEDRATAFERQLDLVSWWAELFESPVVAFDALTTDDVRALASAGADFIAVRWPQGEAQPVQWAERILGSVAAAA